jgi:hypothetical protein
MTRGEMMDEYRRMNSADRKGFQRWLVTNTIVGALAIVALIVVTSVYSEKNQDSAAVAKAEVALHAEAQ